MKFKKQIIIAISCAIVLGGIFFAVSYIGNKDQSKEPKNNTATTTDSKINEANNENKASNDDKTALNQEDKNKETEDKKNTDEDNKNTSMEEVKEGYYTVKSNDTLYSIARTYMPNSDPSEVVAQILTRNNISKDDIISAGQKLIISYETSLVTGENTSEEKGEETAAANATSHTSHTKYVVKSGDTLFSIAKEYLPDMDIMKGIELIKAHNNISADTIKVEDTLCIPNK